MINITGSVREDACRAKNLVILSEILKKDTAVSVHTNCRFTIENQIERDSGVAFRQYLMKDASLTRSANCVSLSIMQRLSHKSTRGNDRFEREHDEIR